MKVVKEAEIKVVKEAEIKVVKVQDLRIGDEILWSDLRCRIEKIDWAIEHREVYFIPVSHDDGNTDHFHFRFYRNYYRLQNFKEVNICIQCSKEIEYGDECDECKKIDEEYAKSLNDEYGVAV